MLLFRRRTLGILQGARDRTLDGGQALNSRRVLLEGKSESVSHSVVSHACDTMDCSPRGTSVHGILQARILKWVAMPFVRGALTQGSNPRLLH